MTETEILEDRPTYRLSRSGRFLVAHLREPHDVLSTAVVNGGFERGLQYLVNHQSCEGAAHDARHDLLVRQGGRAYHEVVCRELALDVSTTAVMGTAANMNYAARRTLQDQELVVTAIVTAGVRGNATCAGDPTSWRETERGWQKLVSEPAHLAGGTINTALFVSLPVTPGALARVAMTITEAKTAALNLLAVRSLYSSALATGTGTDQFAIAAPQEGARVLSSASTHVRFGELLAATVRDATLEALRWQNGLEPSSTRCLSHILGRRIPPEDKLIEDLALRLAPEHATLLRRNWQAVAYEPTVTAAIAAWASVLDRVDSGAIPSSAAHLVLRQHAATIASNLAAKPDAWPRFFQDLTAPEPRELLLCALALGWSSKWE